jgi:hypothetical protein
MVSVIPTFNGKVSGIVDEATFAEIAIWLSRGYVAPLGVLKFAGLEGGGTLREDVGAAWTVLAQKTTQKGGTIAGPYGDTRRPLMKAISVGASKYSFHIVGRAVDLNQTLGDPRGQRYFILRETSGGVTWWRIYCKTDDQQGSQGVKVPKGTIQAYRFGDGQLYYIPEGYYLDLTAEIEEGGQFERIHAQSGWTASGPGYRKTEWWHFQWAPDKQPTFQDECELVGITEQQLRNAGYTDEDLDHVPG